MVLIRWSGMPHCTAAVAAPMRKLWLENCPGIPAPCNTNWMKDTDENELKADHGCRWAGDVNMPGWTKLDRARPRYMKHPWGNKSFLELLMHTQRLEGLTSTSTCESWTVKWMDGSKAELTINSPALRNPKKPRQQAAHSMTCSELWVSKERWINRMRWAVTGWRCGRVEPWWRLMPRRRRWSWRQFTKGSGKPWSMCKDRIAER